MCLHGQTAATPCAMFTSAAAANRLPNGSYNPSFTNTLPIEVRAVDSSFLDVLTNYAVATPGAFAAGSPELAMETNPAGVVLATLGVAVTVARVRPALVDQLYDAVTLLLNAGGTASEVARVTGAMTQLAAMQSQNAAKLTQAVAPTAARHLQQNYPLATLFQTCVKGVEKGLDLKPESGEMFDTTSGKRYVPFPGATKTTSGAKLMHSLDVFCDTIISLKNQAPFVWREFKRRVMLCESTEGFIFAQEFVDAILRKLDEKVYTDILALMRAGEHNRILDEIKHHVKNTFDPKGRKPWTRVVLSFPPLRFN